MKKLVIFTVTDINKMLGKGNVWYLKHYESYFDEVHVLYLLGSRRESIVNGKTTLVALGTGNNIMDMLLSPYRIYKFAKKTGFAYYLTADSLFLWWTSILIKIFLKAKIYFMPVCIPQELYKNSKRSLTGIPIWMEKVFLKLCFRAADYVITTKNAPGFIAWLSSVKGIQSKLKVADILVEEMPTIEFYNILDKDFLRTETKERIILYVGRLHREKMVEDIIKMFACLKKYGLDARLKIIGDGEDRIRLENMAIELDIKDKVDFLGQKPNSELVGYYKGADVFVSPITGSSLREAALCKLPVVAYDIDWVRGLLIDGKNSLLVGRGDVEGMAMKVKKVLIDREFAKNISNSLYDYAIDRWSMSKAALGLEQAFKN